MRWLADSHAQVGGGRCAAALAEHGAADLLISGRAAHPLALPHHAYWMSRACMQVLQRLGRMGQPPSNVRFLKVQPSQA